MVKQIFVGMMDSSSTEQAENEADLLKVNPGVYIIARVVKNGNVDCNTQLLNLSNSTFPLFSRAHAHARARALSLARRHCVLSYKYADNLVSMSLRPLVLRPTIVFSLSLSLSPLPTPFLHSCKKLTMSLLDFALHTRTRTTLSPDSAPPVCLGIY